MVRLGSGKDRQEITYSLRHWSGWVQKGSRRNHVQAEDAETRKIGQAGFRKGSRRNHVQAEDAKTRIIGQVGFREGSRRNYVQSEILVRLGSGKDREGITYILTIRKTRKNGQAGFREGSRRNHVHPEDAETR